MSSTEKLPVVPVESTKEGHNQSVVDVVVEAANGHHNGHEESTGDSLKNPAQSTEESLEAEKLEKAKIELEEEAKAGIEAEKLDKAKAELEEEAIAGIEAERLEKAKAELEEEAKAGIEADKLEKARIELEEEHQAGIEAEKLEKASLDLEEEDKAKEETSPEKEQEVIILEKAPAEHVPETVEEAKAEAVEKQAVSFQEEVDGNHAVVERLAGMTTNGDVIGADDLQLGVEDNSMAVDIPEIELIIKASTIDGRRRGACIFCQEYFMDLYLLAELKAISLKITTVDMKRPPVDFRSNFEAAQPPILIDTGVAILENEKIERHIMKHIPGGHNLFVPDSVVEKKLESLYNKFKMMLVRRDESSKKQVIAILKRIDETLMEKDTRFLTGDTLCCFDCELMPKLQHIRVAGRFFADFDIPIDMMYLWKYVKEMYELDAFTQSCPADQDIIHIYKMQGIHTSNTLTRQGSKNREELEEPTYLTSIPDGI